MASRFRKEMAGFLKTTGLMSAYMFSCTMPLHLLKRNHHIEECRRQEAAWRIQKNKEYEESLRKKFFEALKSEEGLGDYTME